MKPAPPDVGLKVLFVSHYSGRYGANCSMVDLAVELMKRNVKVVVVLPGKGDVEAELRGKNIRYVTIYHKNWARTAGAGHSLLRRVFTGLVNFLADLRLFLFAGSIGANLVHINSSCTPVGYRASRWLKVPVVWHIREYLEEDYGLSFLNKRSAMTNIGQANKVIAVSRDLAAKYRDRLGQRLGVIYNGVPGTTSSSRPLLERERINLLLVGVLDPCKGHLDALKAVAIAKHELGLKVRLIIVGEGRQEYLDELMNTIQEFDIGDEIEFLGYRTNLDHIRIEADIGLVCSRREAFGRVTVEAMASGMLVVASRTGGTPEIVQHGRTGLLYEGGDYRQLAETLVWIDKNRQLARRLAKLGRKHALAKFNMERVADEVLEAYSECMGVTELTFSASGSGLPERSGEKRVDSTREASFRSFHFSDT